MKNPKGVLFDLDGTLLDTADDLGAALNYVLEKNGLPIVGRDKYYNRTSHGSKGLIELGFAEQLPCYNFDELRTDFLNFYSENICEHTKMYPGVEMLLEQLNSWSIPWGIVTNKPEALAIQLLEYFPILMACPIVVGGDTFKQRKPHPFPLLHAAKVLNVEPNQCLYIGDAERDIEAANSAEMYSIIANYGYIEEEDDVSNWCGDAMIETFSDLRSFFE
ncbi:HAD family hydrolase [Alteromonadaceae bacterium M269]|nr:HAD family hydrolase [Alteromonadaceae bacterium M269]